MKDFEKNNTASPKFRYPGTQPFNTSEADIFFGREDAIESLHNFIQLHQVSVLFSKSGLGKSSLINAGLIPLLEKQKNLRPIHIRFQSYNKGQEPTPTYITRRNIVKGRFEETFLDTIIRNEPSLWHDVKEQQIISEEPPEFVLIFDQFEELFTYPAEQIREFEEQLAELLFSRVPQRYRDVIKKQEKDGVFSLDKGQLDQIYAPNNVKVLLSIRSDRMHLLNNLSDHFPSILANCYELKPLAKAQAQDAIFNPALSRAKHFISPSFDYSTEAVNAIIDFLSKGGSKPIESFYLQMICNAIEKKVMANNIDCVNASDLGDLERLIENYYLDQLSTIEEEQERKKAQRLIEEGLIFEAEKRRVSLIEGQIRQTYGVGPELLEQLIDSRLIRAESLPDGGYAYELSHDALVSPILKIKQSRKEREEKDALIRQAAEAKEREQKARARQARARRITVALIGLSILAFGSMVLATSQYWKTENVKAQLSEFTRKYGYPKLQERIRNLEYSNAFQDWNSIHLSIQDDSSAMLQLLEIAYVFNETGKVDSAREVMGLVREVSQTEPAGVSSGRDIRQSIEAYMDQYGLNTPALSARYYPQMARPILAGADSVCFAKTEASVWQYYLFCESEGLDITLTASNWGIRGDYPVVKVDWYEAISYANWLSKRQGLDTVYQIEKPEGAEGLSLQEDTTKNEWAVGINRAADGYRLPTLAEWRAAAAYPSDPGPFIAGLSHLSAAEADRAGSIAGYAWYLDNSRVMGVLEPHPVAQLKPNLLGLYDMSGNLWEWCEDESSEEGHEDEKLKAIAGGAFNMPAGDCTADSKNSSFAYKPNRKWYNTTGFRLCRTVHSE